MSTPVVMLPNLSSKCGSATLLDPPRGAGRAAGPDLGVLSSKCGSATLLDPRGGRAGRSPDLGALISSSDSMSSP